MRVALKPLNALLSRFLVKGRRTSWRPARGWTSRATKPRAVGALIIGVAVVAACATAGGPPPAPAPPPPQPSGPLLSVEHWQAKFDDDAPGLRANNLSLSRSTDSWDFYTLSYSIDAFAGMFEATGETRYADVALGYLEDMVASARPSSSFPRSSFGDDYLGWVSQQPGVRGREVALNESYCWRYATRLLRVLRASPLYQDPVYRGRYDRLLAFAETDIFEKWYSRSADDFIYRSRTHTAAHWAYIALDLAELTTDESRRARYLEVVRNIDHGLPNYPSSLRAQLRASPTDPVAYWWSDIWGEFRGPGQDVSHGNGVISYIVEARDVDGGWSAGELAGFSRTLTSFVLGADGRYPEYVDGSGSGNGWIADGFVKLGRYDPAVQAVLQDYGVQNAQYYAAMAVNAKILETGGTR